MKPLTYPHKRTTLATKKVKAKKISRFLVKQHTKIFIRSTWLPSWRIVDMRLYTKKKFTQICLWMKTFLFYSILSFMYLFTGQKNKMCVSSGWIEIIFFLLLQLNRYISHKILLFTTLLLSPPHRVSLTSLIHERRCNIDFEKVSRLSLISRGMQRILSHTMTRLNLFNIYSIWKVGLDVVWSILIDCFVEFCDMMMTG